MKLIGFMSTGFLAFVLAGCETTNSIPYDPPTTNVITIQNTLEKEGKKVSVGNISLSPGVEESPMCRLNGPIKVAPGKSLPEYIEEAFREELFMAGVYDSNAESKINGKIEKLSFSSVSPAYWDISMKVSSNVSPGYTVSIHYPFDTSWTAYSACKNVANAFGPAVQSLLREVVTNPNFSSLVK